MLDHLEVLVEDSSGKLALESLLPKILGPETSFRIHAYRGIGHIPKKLSASADPRKRILLNRLPQLISGYGRAFANDPFSYKQAVLIVCDLDNRPKSLFIREILAAIEACSHKPEFRLCLAIEEGEAWLLGDEIAVLDAYPKVSRAELQRYIPDSICGTWEFLADIILKGGSKSLKKLGFVEVGRAKHEWASNIAPRIDIDRNVSPSFSHFVAALRSI